MLENRHTRVLRQFVLAAFAFAGFSSTAHAEWVNIGKHSFPRLCPQHIGGDREYAGHGPEVTAEIELYTDASGRELWLRIWMHQIETRADWSEAELTRRFRLFRAPVGHTISAVWANGVSYPLAGATEPGGGGPIEDLYYRDTDHDVDRFYPNTWVSSVAIIGDTSGNDIGNCTADDAYISVDLATLWVWY